jgi:hypothetical protein
MSSWRFFIGFNIHSRTPITLTCVYYIPFEEWCDNILPNYRIILDIFLNLPSTGKYRIRFSVKKDTIIEIIYDSEISNQDRKRFILDLIYFLDEIILFSEYERSLTGFKVELTKRNK